MFDRSFLTAKLLLLPPLPGLQIESMTPDEMLGKLRSRAGKWHNLAKMLPYLYRQGYDSSVVDQMTGITPAVQVKSDLWKKWESRSPAGG
jgi:hypothetical protein